MCVCMARPTKSASQIRVPTPGKGGGEGRESSGSMLTIQIFGHLRT